MAAFSAAYVQIIAVYVIRYLAGTRYWTVHKGPKPFVILHSPWWVLRPYIWRHDNIDTPTKIGLPEFFPCSMLHTCYLVQVFPAPHTSYMATKLHRAYWYYVGQSTYVLCDTQETRHAINWSAQNFPLFPGSCLKLPFIWFFHFF